MMTRAIIFIPEAATPADLQQPLAGVPLLLRLLLSAQRAGVGEIVLLGSERFVDVWSSVTQDPRVLAGLLWVEDQPWSTLVHARPEMEKQWCEGDLWVLPATGVIDVTLLRQAMQHGGSRPVAVIEAWPEWSPASAGAFCRVAGPYLRSVLEASGDVRCSTVLRQLPQSGDIEPIPNRDRICAPCALEADRLSLERGLFTGLQSASDGWVDRYLNRRFSPWLSRRLLRTSLTPNQVTLIAFAVGLLAALSFAWGGWFSGVLGALLLQGSAIIDCCDGEVARLKFQESPSGYYLDIACDNVVHVAVFAAVAWSSYDRLGQSYWLVLGGLAAFGTIMAFVVVLITRHGRVRHPSLWLERLVDSLTNRDFSILLLLCALTGTLTWFLWALAVGVNLFWPVVLGLAWKTRRASHG
jgi:phosphatidylglycerophosphate synthase